MGLFEIGDFLKFEGLECGGEEGGRGCTWFDRWPSGVKSSIIVIRAASPLI